MLLLTYAAYINVEVMSPEMRLHIRRVSCRIDPFTVYVTGKFAVRMSGSERSFHPIVLTREFLVKTKLRAVTVADFYHRGGNGPTTTGGAVL